MTHTLKVTLELPHGEETETMELLPGSLVELVRADSKRVELRVDEQLAGIVMPAPEAEVEAMQAAAEAEASLVAGSAGVPAPAAEKSAGKASK